MLNLIIIDGKLGPFQGLRMNKNLRYSVHSRILVFHASFVRLPNKLREKIKIFVNSPEQKKKHSGEMPNKILAGCILKIYYQTTLSKILYKM